MLDGAATFRPYLQGTLNLGESIKCMLVVIKCSYAMLVLQGRYKEDAELMFSLGPDKRLGRDIDEKRLGMN